eukprot:TRINITY_DN1030_c0_g2_i3.p1 TRINITY_DN1030_c0_g2~~TRINITY_DN1030_c0_g2_i3.p1  ORF type:complete len:167 (+),score=22.05 TRINITY_DN1030_c0_g2_i3:74-574(+)
MSNQPTNVLESSPPEHQTSSEISQSVLESCGVEHVVARILSDAMWTSQDLQTLSIIFPELRKEHEKYTDISRTTQNLVQKSASAPASHNPVSFLQMDERLQLNTSKLTSDAASHGRSAADPPAISPRRAKTVFRRSNGSKRISNTSDTKLGLKENVSPALNMQEIS